MEKWTPEQVRGDGGERTAAALANASLNWSGTRAFATLIDNIERDTTVLQQLVLSIIAFGAVPMSGMAQPQCQVRYATKFVNRFADLPDQIQNDVLKGGKIADFNQPFEAYDNIADPDLPRRRIVLAGNSGIRWFVWIDHGGFNRHDDVFGFSQLWEKVDTFIWHRSAQLQGDPCIAINAFLDGVSTPGQIEK